ncbi:MAG TPA: NAD-dependent epimerase/dehydratase family protein [Candidatus Saccharimonadales bacterium]|nr:NAD-dependent epimerase/dehydratase family protein [Candidatus Saccharimonadales bacterium]
MKTLFIIGSNGVLGADLVRNLQSSYTVVPINRDTYAQIKGKSCDILINANGNSKRFWANDHILEDFEASTTSVYKSLFDFEFKKYIYISSSDVYVDHTNKETTKENQRVDFANLSPYGFHKYLSETLVQKYAEKYFILRSSMILGKNLKKGPVYDIVQKKPLFITLDSQIQMITTTAISSIIDSLVKNDFPNDIFNMGGKGTVDFNDSETYFGIKPQVTKDAKKQIYEMNVEKLDNIFKLKSSPEYLKEYLTTYEN